MSVGADVYARGWVAVELDGGRFVRAWSAPTLDVALAGVPSDTAVGLDIPLGGLASGWRAADLLAKRRLGPWHSRVFAVPPRPVWELASHAEASARSVQLTGSGLSIQAWGLIPRMLEAERYRDSDRHELYEVHPELVFARLAGAPLAASKKTWNGQMARRALLAGVGVVLPDDLPDAAGVPADDVLDAAAVAYRVDARTGEVVPDPPQEYDHRGRPIVIWF